MLKNFVAVAIVLASGGSAWAAGINCGELSKLKLDHVEITSVTAVGKGAFTPPANPNGGGGGGGGQAYANLPAFCRVEATSRPTADSEIKFEVWMPAEGWTGRLAEFGNGGFQSSIGYGNLALAVAKGYAGTASNTGKTGNNGDSLIGHPEKVKDWGFRALHESLVAAKAISAAYYGNGPKYTYYSGCSTGGRQGWVAAEYYPKDFDGLAIGDPANPMTRLQLGVLWSYEVLNKDEANRLTAEKWNMIRDAVMNQCDAKDGLKDGLIEDPMACHFDPKSIQCKSGDAADCLTAPQVEMLTKFYRGAVNPRTGEQIFPGFSPGSQMTPGPFVGTGPSGSIDDAKDTFRVLYQKPDWDFNTLDFDKDVARSDKLGNDTMNAVDPSKLKPLFAGGGKVLLYHGWWDPAITPLDSIQLYQGAVAANGGLGKTYNDIRLFMVPGMAHCGGGIGPNTFDKLDAISAWVESGKAPDEIVASHATNGVVDRTRPLCPYPQIAKYKDSGSIDEAQNFVCSKP